LTYHSHIGQASKYLRDLIRLLPPPSLSLRPLDCCAMISLSRERELLWLSTSLCFATNSLIRHDRPYKLVSQVPLFLLSRRLASLCVSHTGSATDWCALREALCKYIDTYNVWGHEDQKISKDPKPISAAFP